MFILGCYFIAAFIVQLLIWFCFREPLCLILYTLTYPISLLSDKYTKITVGILLFIINILISMILSTFTGTGNMIGIANLFSSVFVSFIMINDYNKLVRSRK